MALRAKVLECFKCLHRARKDVFEGDKKALLAARLKIKEEFMKYKDITDEGKIKELIEFGYQVVNELRTTVIQARLTPEGTYRIRITKDTKLMDSPGDPVRKNNDLQ